MRRRQRFNKSLVSNRVLSQRSKTPGRLNVRSAIHSASAAVALAAAVAFTAVTPAPAAETPAPAADARACQKVFTEPFPNVKLEDFVNGSCSTNEHTPPRWEEKEQFPTAD